MFTGCVRHWPQKNPGLFQYIPGVVQHFSRSFYAFSEGLKNQNLIFCPPESTILVYAKMSKENQAEVLINQQIIRVFRFLQY